MSHVSIEMFQASRFTARLTFKKIVDIPGVPLIQLDTFMGSQDAFNVAKRFFNAASLKTLILKVASGPDHLTSIIKQCPGLEILEFGVRLWGQQPGAVAIFESVASLENLTSLKMRGAHLENENLMKDFIRSLGHRRRISSIALSCDDEIIREIAKNLSFLKSVDLDIRKCKSSKPLIKMVTKLKQLETLHFRAGNSETKVNSRVMESIVANLTELKSLHIERPKCESTDFDGLVALPLKELHIKGANLENSTIKIWKKSGLGSSLESLVLTNWEGGLKRTVLAKLIKKSPRLHRLHLSNVTDKVAMAIATSCPLLIDLALMKSEDLSLESVQSISDNCGNLKFLRLDASKYWDRSAFNYGKYRIVKTYWGDLSDYD